MTKILNIGKIEERMKKMNLVMVKKSGGTKNVVTERINDGEDAYRDDDGGSGPWICAVFQQELVRDIEEMPGKGDGTVIEEAEGSEGSEKSRDVAAVESVEEEKGEHRLVKKSTGGPKLGQKRAARIEGALERRREDIKDMQEILDRENRRHLEALDQVWVNYWTAVESEIYRHSSITKRVYETYQGRMAGRELLIREMYRKAMVDEDIVPEDGTIVVESPESGQDEKDKVKLEKTMVW